MDGAAGPYQVIAGPFRNTYLLRDPNVNRLNKWRYHFYKLRIVHRGSGDTAEFGPQWLQAEPDLITLEIQRRHQLVMQEFNGRGLILFPALTSGQTCPRCYDRGPRGNTIGRQKSQNCIVCYDIAFVGGFATPMLIYGQIDPSPRRTLRTDTVELQPVDTTARVSAFPPLGQHDMIVEAENVRWQVEMSTPTKKLRAIVHQELTLHEVPVSSIKYKVPILVDQFMDFAPGREFTRPMSLDNDPLPTVGDIFKGDS